MHRYCDLNLTFAVPLNQPMRNKLLKIDEDLNIFSIQFDLPQRSPEKISR